VMNCSETLELLAKANRLYERGICIKPLNVAPK
jgi:hypothetical protein